MSRRSGDRSWVSGMDVMKSLHFCSLALLMIAMVFLIAPLGCSPRNNTTADLEAPMVRVRLLNNVDRVNLSCADAPTIAVDGGRSKRKLGVGTGQTVVLTLGESGWLINGVDAGAGVMEMTQTSDGSVAINGLPYRGTFRFVPVTAGRFDVVNDLDVESYLKGVLAKELFSDWHPEAYRAQAIIARTYALYEVKTNPTGRHWDLHPDVKSQVYGGMKAETEKATLAVQATRGAVVVYGPEGQEKIFKAYFSSCCGGVSAAAGDVFGGQTIPPLEARFNGNTCSLSTRYNWGPIVVSKSELTRRLKLWGAKEGHAIANMPGVANVEIAMSNQFGRPRRYVITDTAGQQYSLLAEQMRWAINTDAAGGVTVFSSFFTPVAVGNDIQFTDGHGHGHGVGACQWCMQGRALAGDTAQTIVMKNFPSAKVVVAY